MKKIAVSLAFLSSILLMAQETPKKDSVATKSIEGVTVSKKVFQKKADRLVYDVAASPVAKGNTAFNVLKETPLVSSTDDKTLKISGKSNAVIYINGKRSLMNAEALEAMLKNTPAENIQKIEVITLPGSEYNVESSDGIINIILKKKQSDGINGNLRLSSTQFRYNNQSSSASLNARKGKLGASASISYSDEIRLQEYLLENGNNFSRNVSTGMVENRDRDLGGYINLDYELSEKQNVGVSYNYWQSITPYQNTDLFNITSFMKDGQPTTRYTRSQNGGDASSFNRNLNLNYELKLDDKGSRLDVNAAYLHYNKYEGNTNTTNLVTAQNQMVALLSQFHQSTPQKITSYTGNVDFKKTFKAFTLGLGVNYSTTKTDNDTYFENLNLATGEYIKDLNQSNHFVYQEDIGGIYTNIEKNFGEKLSAKAGTRVETTNSFGEILGSDISVKRNSVNILPTLSLNYNINQNNALSYSFTSRMRRPSFWELNPVRTYLTEYNYVQNNPFMKASTIYNHELMYMFKNAYFLQISDTYTKNGITQVPLQKNENGISVMRYIRTNYGTENNVAINVGMNRQFFKGIWTASYTAGLQINSYRGSVGTDPITGETFEPFIFDYDKATPFFQASNNIRLSPKKDWFLGVNYFYLGKSRNDFGTLSPIQQMDLSLKKIMDAWTFALDVRDIFNTMKITIADIQASGNYNSVTNNMFRRRGTLSITYNFGNQKIQKVRKIESAADDIKSRTGSN